ncbi:hypothetical protein [Paremcibacter congregatus]|nr:hypothetical protein [Paremcibacter congregatus]
METERMKMLNKILWTVALIFTFTATAQAHIDLVSPKPLMGGHGMDDTTLKVAPFGAPGVDVEEADALTVKAGSELELVIDGYVTHPGYIVVSYTTDLYGQDVMPIRSIPDYNTPIPHKNILMKIASPCPEGNCKPRRVKDNVLKTKVKLPDVTGDIILVVRQVMTDKFDNQPDGSISLKRIYYHQGAKLKLVR